MRIVFMGTPDYSVFTLQALLDAGHEVVGVFAQPDKPVGRKRVMTAPPVAAFAKAHGLPLFQPTTLRDGTALEILKELNPQIIVAVAYGKILPQEILDFPPYGCINGHASLLPKYRGASPIQWCIVCGERETGVTTMQMDAGMDTGDVLLTVKTSIGQDETAEELFDRLAPLSAELMVETLTQIENGTVVAKKQPEDGVSYAPILKKEMALLDFSKPAAEVYNAVRGYYSWPCAYFLLDGKRVKVLKARLGVPCKAAPGTVLVSGKRAAVACGDGGSLELLCLQPEGGKPLSCEQLLCGHLLCDGVVVNT